MTCRQLAPDVIDHSRGIALDPRRLATVTDHLQNCAACGALSERERAMSRALRGLADAQPAPSVSDRELEALVASFDAPRGKSRRIAIGVGLSVAASALIVAGLTVGWNAWVLAPSKPAVAPAPAETADSFVLLAGASALPRFERGEVIRVEISSPEGAIQADVLVGQDGLARAVRLVN
jgi:predicted anti-sigma-YlaC factor YlaD